MSDFGRPLIALGLLAAAAYFATDAEAAQQPAEETGDTSAGTWLDALTDWMPDMSIGSRAQRNNNPGNIRHGNNWQGEVAGSDAAFESFATPADGFRALAKVLRKYQTIHGLRTVRSIITRYAPRSENDTAAYVASVAAAMGVSPDQQIDLNNDATLAAMMRAIATHEDRRAVWADADLYAGVALA